MKERLARILAWLLNQVGAKTNHEDVIIAVPGTSEWFVAYSPAQSEWLVRNGVTELT